MITVVASLRVIDESLGLTDAHIQQDLLNVHDFLLHLLHVVVNVILSLTQGILLRYIAGRSYAIERNLC